MHQHTQGVLNYMFCGEKIWRLESPLVKGHTAEVKQVRVTMYCALVQTCFDVYDRPHDVMRNCHVVIMVFVI